MGKECVHIAIDVLRLNRRSKCGYFSPCKQGRGLARNGVQTLECINKDILSRMQRHPRTQSTMGGEGQALFREQTLLREPFLKGGSAGHACDGINKGRKHMFKILSEVITNVQI